MRVTTNTGDPWKTRYPFAYKIKFNNKYIFNCILADEKLGLIEVYEEDKLGNYVIEDGCIKTLFEVGSVKVERNIISIIITSINYFLIRNFR